MAEDKITPAKKIENHQLIKELKKKGMKFVILEAGEGGIRFKLEGKILWHNADGTTTELEESGQIGNINAVSDFETLAKHYLENADRYTNFVKDDA